MNKVPNPLKFNQAVFDFALHPTDDLVATGLINGEIHCYRYGVEEHQSIWTAKPFRKSCRGLEFSPDGNGLYGISKDRSIQFMDTATGQLIRSKTESHENPLNVLLCLNERLLATGDDQGIIKLWDNRKPEAVMTWSEHEDFIADMAYNAEQKTLVAAGGDGYLSTWDIRKPDVAAMSDNMEDELLSVALVKNGRKAVVGSQEGVLSLWSWGDWGDYKDRIIGHPNSIDAICKLDEDTICTGSSDGLIRIVTILPNQFHGIIGDHGEGMPIERIKLSHDKKYLLSCGHDESLRFWDVAHLFEEEDDQEEDETKEDTEDKESSLSSTALPVEAESNEKQPSDEKEDKSDKEDKDDDGDQDSWDDSDDSEPKKLSKKKRRKQQKKAMQEQKKPKKASTFFADL